MKCFTLTMALIFAAGILQLAGQLNDSEFPAVITHQGDPPFLLESGWIPLLNGENMKGWEYVPNTGDGGWTATPAVIWDESNKKSPLRGAYISGDRIVNTVEPPGKVASDLVTKRKFGDAEIYLEFFVADNTNSGVYVHGIYEVQVVNSYGKKDPSAHATCGAIYDYDKQVDGEWVGAVAPLVRAERPSGQWQSYHIHFQAPRFDENGNKTSNAKFIRVLQNGKLIQENVERKAMTRAGMKIPEAPENPLMLQGNHGPIAYRNIYIRPIPLPEKKTK